MYCNFSRIKEVGNLKLAANCVITLYQNYAVIIKFHCC